MRSELLQETADSLHMDTLSFEQAGTTIFASQDIGDVIARHHSIPTSQEYGPIGSEFDSEDEPEDEDWTKEKQLDAMLHHAYVDRDEFNDAINLYVNRLHDTKQGKALITAAGYNTLLSCLLDPSDTSLIDAQYRHWAREGHRVLVAGSAFIIVDKHGLPLAVREQIYDVISACHDATGHGGRDKTAAIVFSLFSGIPKELIGEFVRLCKCCQKLRPTGIDNSLAAKEAAGAKQSKHKQHHIHEIDMQISWPYQTSPSSDFASQYDSSD